MKTAIKSIADRPLGGATEPHVAFDLYRVPFFLEPDYPESEDFFESNRERLVKKWGGQAGWETQKKRHGMKERGLEAGIPKFNLDRHASQTLASHIFVQWVSRTYGLDKSEEVYDRLNTLHFVEGRRLNDRAMLVGVAAECGLDAGLAEAALASGEGRAQVKATYRRVQELGVHSIPTFVLDGGGAVLGGAAHARELEAALREVEADVVAGNTTRRGPIFSSMLQPSHSEGGGFVGAAESRE